MRSTYRAISPRFAIKIEFNVALSVEELDSVAAVLVDDLEVDKRATGPKRDPVRRRPESAIVDAERRDRAASKRRNNDPSPKHAFPVIFESTKKIVSTKLHSTAYSVLIAVERIRLLNRQMPTPTEP